MWAVGLLGLLLAVGLIVSCSEKSEQPKTEKTEQTSAVPVKKLTQGTPPSKVAQELNKVSDAYNLKASTCGDNCLKLEITPSFELSGKPSAAGIAPYLYYAVGELCKSGLAPFANVEIDLKYKTKGGTYDLLMMKGLKTDFCTYYDSVKNNSSMDIVKGYQLLNLYSNSAIKIKVENSQGVEEICKGMENFIGSFCKHLGF